MELLLPAPLDFLDIDDFCSDFFQGAVVFRVVVLGQTASVGSLKNRCT